MKRTILKLLEFNEYYVCVFLCRISFLFPLFSSSFALKYYSNQVWLFPVCVYENKEMCGSVPTPEVPQNEKKNPLNSFIIMKKLFGFKQNKNITWLCANTEILKLWEIWTTGYQKICLDESLRFKPYIHLLKAGLGIPRWLPGSFS